MPKHRSMSASVLLRYVSTLTLMSIIGVYIFSLMKISSLISSKQPRHNDTSYDQIFVPVDETEIRKKTTPDTWSVNISHDQISVPFDETKTYEKTTLDASPVDSTIAWSNITTIARKVRRSSFGFCNQMMRLNLLIIHAVTNGHGQIMLDSIPMMDSMGSNRAVPFDDVWDVPHFNSHYPHLPRLVTCREDVFHQYDCVKNEWYWTNGTFRDRYGNKPEKDASSPFVDGLVPHHSLGIYMGYTKGRSSYQGPDGGRHPAEILVLQGALRPHPNLQKVIDSSMRSFMTPSHVGSGGIDMKVDYIALHARVEPDMQIHPMCPDKKVLKISDIFNFMERTWPDPPAPHVFLSINRLSLESGGRPDERDPSKTNGIAVDNLRALNEARDEGLWNGRAKLHEFGTETLVGTPYEQRRIVVGSILDFFINVNAKIFIGTEVSSFSYFLMATRFFRKNSENYKYLPSGIHPWTSPGIKTPDGFMC